MFPPISSSGIGKAVAARIEADVYGIGVLTRPYPAADRTARILASAALLACLSLSDPARAQGVDCSALKTRIDAAQQSGDTERVDLLIRQDRAELDRVRSYADDSGCGNGLFDDPDTPQCRTLARRVQQLQSELRRLQDPGSRPEPDADVRRRGLIEQFNAYCAGTGDEAADPERRDVAPAVVPVDPDAPTEEVAPAPKVRFAQVLCVRQCDGAYYPLAVDVASDQIDGMDKICKAQCPSAEASAFTSDRDEDVGKAVASDGATYAALPAAFKFRSKVVANCSCRGPHQSWAEALAQADSLLQPRKGDVTVTPDMVAAMTRPTVPPAATPVPGKSGPAKKSARKVSTPPVRTPAAPAGGAEASAPNPGEDLTRQFRQSAPLL